MKTTYMMALAVLTLGMAVTAQAETTNNNSDTDYVFKRFQEGKSGYYGVSPITDIGNPSAKQRYEEEKAREAAQQQANLQKTGNEKSGK